MACIITYENKQYTQKEFEQYFKEHFIEFVDNFLGSKQDIEGFKKRVDNNQSNVQYQLPQDRELEEYVASEKTIRDLAERMADRIGLKVRYESDRTKKYKGKLEGDTAVINLAYATLDTPIHEILGHPIIRAIKNRKLNQEDSSFNKLYENLLEELSTTQRGKEVLDRVKRDYRYKNATKEQIESDELYVSLGAESSLTKYTLEEQQEEAIVELLGLYTADRLDKVKDGKLISLLKRLLKEMKAFMKNLLFQREVEIDKLSDNMTLGDIADLLAYSNSKLILPGYEVIYTTPDNQQFKTYAEASKHISRLFSENEKLTKKENQIQVWRADATDGNFIVPTSKREQLEYGLGIYFGDNKDTVVNNYQHSGNNLHERTINVNNNEIFDLDNFDKEIANKVATEFEKLGGIFTFLGKQFRNNPRQVFKNLENQIEGENWITAQNTINKVLKENGIKVIKVKPVDYEGNFYTVIDDSVFENQDVDLSNIKVENILPDRFVLNEFDEHNATETYFKENGQWYLETQGDTFVNKEKITEEKAKKDYTKYAKYQGNLNSFIDKNKEYEQSKEIIEEWKKVNNIQYNPEEVYSRGQEFVSVVGAYSDFDVNLMMQNLLQHIEDNQKAGGEFTISAFTKPVDKQIGHLEGGGGKIKFKIYPKSQDIKWAANTDVYSGSVWDASEKVSKDKKSELLGVSYTKYPSLQNINSVQPNLASIIDNLAHHHNELGISLTGSNFRLEYDENIPYSTKKLINSINSILDQKYGKLAKPKIDRLEKNDFRYTVEWNDIQNPNEKFYFKTEKEAIDYATKLNTENGNTKTKEDIEDYGGYVVRFTTHKQGIQPTQTKETLKESIESVSEKIGKDVYHIQLNSGLNKYVIYGSMGVRAFDENFNSEKEAQDFLDKKYPKKEYTSQALINTKIDRLKSIAKKYPRSLIRSEVRRIDSNSNSGFTREELPFQKIASKQDIEGFREFINKGTWEELFERYQNTKFEYINLNEENKQYLKDKKITRKIYDRMTRLEKEILFHCKA